MKMAAAYVRVSTDDQLEFSPDSQIKRLKDYAKSNDYLLLDDYIFLDEGISGRRAKNRTEFNRMIGLAKTKPAPFEAILVWKFSRFARSREDSIVYKSMLRKQCGIQVISISESLGDDKTSILIEALIEAMDEYYSINLAEEVRRGMTEKASRGGVVAAPPYGYSLKDGVYTPNQQADMVRRIFTDFVAGEGMRALAQKYGALGVRTLRGNPPDNRFIEYMLRNPVYIGKIRWCANGRGASRRDYNNPNNIVVPGEHAPIIADELFQQAQERLDQLRAMYGKYQRREQPVQFMLKGMLRCSNCGSTLVYVSTKCPTLQCHEYAKGRCGISHAISIKKANSSVLSAMQEDIRTMNFNLTPADRPREEPIDTTALIEKEKIKLERAKLAYTEGVDTLEEYRANKAAIQSRIQELSISTPPPVKHDLQAYAKKVKKVVEVLLDAGSTEEAKNKALRSIVSEIIYQKETQSLAVHYYI